jgi:phenylalanyl-tRNA synthetase beta chain
MKTSLQWLGDFLPGDLDATTAANALTNGGLPVETIDQQPTDTVIDAEVTSNRGDCLSHLGIARELSALLSRELRIVPPAASESATSADSVTSVRIEALDLCPHYTARVIRNVKIQPSPDWIVRRLEAVGLRTINNVVDVTNYVMFELGQPLHAFDLDRLEGRQIVVRRANQGEKIVSIDGHERTLRPDMLVIADALRPVALAGVMGGRDSEVSDATVNVLLESARFDPLSIRKTARALAMMSDSSYRFERAIDPTLPERASLRAAQLILETAGGELLAGMAVGGSTGYQPKTLTLRLPKLKAVLGIDLPRDQVIDALRRLQLSPLLEGDVIRVTVPSWRLDLKIEVDLVEEVARVLGYDRIPVRDEISIRVTAADPDAATMDTIRSVLVGTGYFESITVTFVSDPLVSDFVPPDAKTLLRTDATVRRDNAHLRPSILPGLLEAIRRNQSVGTMGAKLFEIGSTFWTDSAGKVVERRRLAMVGSADYRELRGTVEELLSRLNPDREVNIVPDQRPGYASGACGRIEWGGTLVGHLGRIDRQVADKLDLRELPAAAELELNVLLQGMQHVPQLHHLPKYPAVRRDLSLVVSEATRFDQVDQLIRQTRPQHMEDVEYVTTYRGKPLEAGAKSVTVTLVFRSSEATLISEQVEDAVAKVVAAAKQNLGATLRA